MMLKFTKMHGLGNDFIVIDNTSLSFKYSSTELKKLSDRHFGIGFDQLMLIEPSNNEGIDFHYRIFNADGSEAGQCGNGVRCVARYLIENGLTNSNKLILSAKAGTMKVDVTNFDEIKVNMGIPILDPKQIPFIASKRSLYYLLHLYECEQKVMVVSMGNPHAIVKVEDIDTSPIETLGRRIAKHEDFPEGVNVGFMQVVDRSHINLRVLERGAGETLACGTGACAAVVVGILNGMLDHCVTVNLLGGQLLIEWKGEGHTVFMTGAAVRVFEGQVI